MADRKKDRDLFIAIQVAMAKGVGLNLRHEEVVMLSNTTVLEEQAMYAFEERGLDMVAMSLDDIAKVRP